MNRTVVVIGLLVAVAGLCWTRLSKLPLFRLPGDVVVDRPGLRFFFPITTMLIISGVLTLVLWLLRR